MEQVAKRGGPFFGSSTPITHGKRRVNAGEIPRLQPRLIAVRRPLGNFRSKTPKKVRE